MPKISVVIPAYNAMTYLEASLASVLQQTFTDFEVLIVNDGSEDSIIEWASEIKDERVRLISQKNQGPSAARNMGIAHAKGQYIAFLDADDLWDKTKLEKQVQYLEAHPEISLVSTRVVTVDERGQYLRKFELPETAQISLETLLTYNCILCGSTPVIRRECFDKVGAFDTNLKSYEDWDMWIRIASQYRMAAIPEYLVSYRQHQNSLSRDITAMVDGVTRFTRKAQSVIPARYHPKLKKISSDFRLRTAWSFLEKKQYRKALLFAGQALVSNPREMVSTSFMRLLFLIVAKGTLRA